MDSFIKIIEQKKETPFVTTIHTQQIETLKKYIRECKNVFICGSTGVGKTYVLNSVLNDSNSVEIQKEHLNSKSPFLTFIRNTSRHAYIEDYDNDYKSLLESVSDGQKLSRGSLIVTSTTMCFFPNFETIFIPKHKPEKLLTLVENVTDDIKMAAEMANGNIRNFFSYIDDYDITDVFKTSKEFIHDILSTDEPLEIFEHIDEHGHIWDIFQENYLDSKGVNMMKASMSFSDADVIDNYIYSSGNWILIPYFCLSAVIMPKFYMGKPLVKDKIRAGSCWTKYGNYKMRLKKLTEIQRNTSHNIGIDQLCLLKKYAENGDVKPMLDYGLSPQDFDVMNHLAVGSKLKQRDVMKVKKALKDAIAKGS